MYMYYNTQINIILPLSLSLSLSKSLSVCVSLIVITLTNGKLHDYVHLLHNATLSFLNTTSVTHCLLCVSPLTISCLTHCLLHTVTTHHLMAHSLIVSYMYMYIAHCPSFTVLPSFPLSPSLSSSMSLIGSILKGSLTYGKLDVHVLATIHMQ